jgi:hypothetical protein
VPAGSETEAINDVVAPLQRAALIGRGLGDLLPKAAAVR